MFKVDGKNDIWAALVNAYSDVFVISLEHIFEVCDGVCF